MSSALALAALSGGSMDPEIKDMLKILVGDALQKRQKERDRAEKQMLSAAQASKEYHEEQRRKQARCSHRNQMKQTRLAGQRLTGTGQISLVCQYCNKNFFLPPLEGQDAPPNELIPPVDEIGG
jgi:hypothetical protein